MDSIVRVLLYAQDFAEKFIFFPRAGLLAEQCNMQKVLSNFFTGITHWNLINKTSLEWKSYKTKPKSYPHDFSMKVLKIFYSHTQKSAIVLNGSFPIKKPYNFSAL